MVKLGIMGCGNIGRFVMRNLARDDFTEFSLRVIADLPTMKERNEELAAMYNCGYTTDPGSLVDREVDVVLEAATPAAAAQYLPRLLRAGISVLAMSVGAFADPEFLKEAMGAAEEGGSRLLLSTGAIAGLDHLKVAQLFGIDEATVTMTKAPKELAGAPHFDRHPVDLLAIKEPTVVFEGTRHTYASLALPGCPSSWSPGSSATGASPLPPTSTAA